MSYQVFMSRCTSYCEGWTTFRWNLEILEFLNLEHLFRWKRAIFYLAPPPLLVTCQPKNIFFSTFLGKKFKCCYFKTIWRIFKLSKKKTFGFSYRTTQRRKVFWYGVLQKALFYLWNIFILLYYSLVKLLYYRML